MTDEPLLERALTVMPGLQIETYEHNPEGLFNDVLIVNRELVFRFARSEIGADLLEQEARLLDLIRPAVGVEVPNPVSMGRGWMVCPLIAGRALTRKALRSVGEQTQQALAAQLGVFLYRLHTMDTAGLDWEVPATRAPVTRAAWVEIYARIRAKIGPLLLGYQTEWLDDLFAGVLEGQNGFDYRPVLIHADLASYHILYDETAGRVTGVLDFGVAGLGDPAMDIGVLLQVYGWGFVRRMGAVYPELGVLLPRARFYAQALELEWALNGLETGQTFWYTAHLGAARDLGE